MTKNDWNFMRTIDRNEPHAGIRFNVVMALFHPHETSRKFFSASLHELVLLGFITHQELAQIIDEEKQLFKGGQE